MENTLIATDSPVLDDQAMTRAALAAAGVLGVDGPVDTTADWPTDAGTAHVVTAFSGPATGALHLVVDETTAASILADPSTAPSVLGPVLDALGIPTDDIDVDPFSVAATLPEHSAPRHCAQITGDDSSHIWVGLTIEPNSDPRDFEPAAVQSTPSSTGAARTATMGSLAMLSDVDMDVTVELGRTKMPIRELLALQPGMVVEIDRAAGSPIDVLVNGRLIACGEVVVIDEEFGVRITDVASPAKRLRGLAAGGE